MINPVIEQLSSETLAVVCEKIGGTPEAWDISEIGDGNVNLIFKVLGPKGQVLLKQAVPYLRCVGESWPLSLKRNYFEYKTLGFHADVASEYLPEVYAFNETSSSMVMEFLGSHIILRKGMMSGIKYKNFSKHISDYMARTLFFTSDLALSAGKKKDMMKLYCENVDLCKITEDLIFTDPYYKAKENKWTSPELDSLVAEIQNDTKLKVAAIEMKAKFLTSAEALIHGDLHSGSIMVNESETKVIDPEFAFYGPMAFDPGLLIGNFLLSYFSQDGLAHAQSETYENWILNQIVEIWIGFEEKFSSLWETSLTGDYISIDLQNSSDSKELILKVRTAFIKQLFTDSIRFAGAEMIRRILGLAHVADLDNIVDSKKRAACETRALKMARELLVNHQNFLRPLDLVMFAKKIKEEKALQ